MNMIAGSAISNKELIRVIVVAAGKSNRMSNKDKILADLNGLPTIAHSVNVFEECGFVDSILIVASEFNISRINEIAVQMKWNKVTKIIAGGPRRQDSVRNGLEFLEKCDWVIVHDGARPFVTTEMVKRGVESAKFEGCAVPAFPAVDTTKRINEQGLVVATLDRDTLYFVQTPQIFDRTLLLKAHQQITEEVTDDASMIEKLGSPVRIFEGSKWNFKITSEDDLLAANMLSRGNFL